MCVLVCVLLQTTSEKALRKQLQLCFKTDMNEKKAFIKEHVSCTFKTHVSVVPAAIGSSSSSGFLSHSPDAVPNSPKQTGTIQS